MSTRVLVDVTPPLATVRLDGPERNNVLDVTGWGAVAGAFECLSEREDVSCVVVCGTGGRGLSAGSDVGAFAARREIPSDVRAYWAAIGDALRAVRVCRHPTVAVVDGICVGGGLEIAACCDLRLCGESSRFGAPIDRLGLTMSFDELQPLVQLLGASPVLEILLSGELIDAGRALTVGLVNRVHPDEAVLERGYGLAARIAAGAPLVNPWHKKFVRRLYDRDPLSHAERGEAHEAFATEDYWEERKAFVEKRDPPFRG
jgi:enoyl-CoA hydratase/carnithine racemase